MSAGSKPGFLKTQFDSLREMAFLLSLVFLIRTFGFGLYQVPTGSMETTMLVGERFFADKLTILFSKPKRGTIISFNDPLFDYSKNPIKRLWQEYVWGPSNWTKRVIGVPGDEVRGAIEDGKPVVYLNGKKLNEPYLNKYPLIRVWRDDPAKIRQTLQQEMANLFYGNRISSEMANNMMSRKLQRYQHTKSYDPSTPYDKQAFYRVMPNRIFKDDDGKPMLLYPGTPIEPMEKVKNGEKNYWSKSDVFHVKLGPDEYWAMGDNRLGSHDSRFLGPIKERLIHGKIIFRIWSVDSYESWWIVDLIKHPIGFWQRVRWCRFFQWIK